MASVHFRLSMRQAEKSGEDIYIVGGTCRGAWERIWRQDDRYSICDFIQPGTGGSKAAISFTNDEKVDTKIPVDYVKVTKDNAADILKLVK